MCGRYVLSIIATSAALILGGVPGTAQAALAYSLDTSFKQTREPVEARAQEQAPERALQRVWRKCPAIALKRPAQYQAHRPKSRRQMSQ